MQKIFLSLLCVTACILQGNAQQRLFDQPVQLKNCNISVNANPFIATTVIEMEFYNPKDQEVEAYQAFTLNRGQVITDLQLELNGKYREGSIEERWKARQAYNSIVGKRIDPAILQMNGQNSYSLNIYPVAAKSSRKIKFTIVQMMVEENRKLTYSLPLNFQSLTEHFKLDIKINKPSSIPYTGKGLAEDLLFDMRSEEASLSWESGGIILNKPLSFSISQFADQPQFCINKSNGKTEFLMRLWPNVPRYYPATVRSINVYWDVSLSAKQRDLSKELDFLEKYISVNEITKANIILFNHQVQGIIVFNSAKEKFSYIRNYLLTYKYNGATELGNLDFRNVLTDAVLLFSDGINSVGNDLPKLGAVQVNFVTSTYRYDDSRYRNIVGNTGGSIINLYYTEVAKAVKRIDSAENFLFKYNAANIQLNESFPLKLNSSILLSGVINASDNLELLYGNNTALLRSENYFLPATEICDEAVYKKVQMLKAYDSLMYGSYGYYNWRDVVEFGLTHRVVTQQTSYLVLERIEDYIKYKIAPPEELREKCAEMNYVYRSEYKITSLKAFTEQEVLEPVVSAYNKRVSWWSKNETLIDLNRPVPEQNNMDVAKNTGADKNNSSTIAGYSQNSLAGEQQGGLKEVVVTSAFGIKRVARSTSSNSQIVSADQLNAVRNTNINDALAGKVAGMQVRSQSSAALGRQSHIRLRGESGFSNGNGTYGSGVLYVVNGTILPDANDINIDDIEDITVLQGPSAAALFGPEGANGAIVMTLKKARRVYTQYVWTEYKLSSAEDEDYIQAMQNTPASELWDTYAALEKEYRNNTCFYFEMADFFFEKGKQEKAQELMYNAIELCQGNENGLRLAAYMYEKWKCFDKAIAVYKGILSRQQNNLLVKRDLALAYFQNKDIEKAVRTYYAVITAPDDNYYSASVKEDALAEMNAILVMHKNEFDISWINHNLVKALPVDLRISVGSNHDYVNNAHITEPGGETCSNTNPGSKSGGRFTGNSYYSYWQNLGEYSIRQAIQGKYSVKVDAYGYSSYREKIPSFVRVITFKNFQRENMTMETKIYNLDNQYGRVELDEIRW
ncbi:MAG TPA: VIT domain-containing protein [Ferruginibacter sp.]|nr:VIT domain-containing protein [Ferruginibacter sp.]